MTVKVLMVCLGNICRSPTAEAVMRKHVQEMGLAHSIDVDSAGTGDWHIGNPPDPRSIAAAASENIDMAHLRARQVQREDFATFDFIFAMDKQNLADLQAIQTTMPTKGRAQLHLFLDYCGKSDVLEVPDPYFGGEGGFREVLTLLDTAAHACIEKIKAEHVLR